MDFTEILSGNQPQPPKTGYPNLLIMTGPPGVGKSTLSAGLNVNGRKNLVVDFQGGLSHVGGNVFDLRAFQETYKLGALDSFLAMLRQLENLKKGVKIVTKDSKKVEEQIEPFEWDFITLDPLFFFQAILTERAAQLYNSSQTGLSKAKQLAEQKYGKTYTQDQLKTFFSNDPCGDQNNNAGQNGWSFIKMAWEELWNRLRALPKECLIIVAHVKYNKLVKSLEDVVDVKSFNFWPTYANFLVMEASDSCWVNREDENKVYMNFSTKGENQTFKSRWFNERKILISEYVDGNIIYHWDEIFPFLSTNKDN